MTLIAEVFPRLPTPKNMVTVTLICKKSRFKVSFGTQHGKRTQTLLKLAWQHLYHIYWSLWRPIGSKKSVLVICKILRLFPKTLSVEGKYSLVNRDNFMERIEMQVSPKQKTFSHFFSGFLKCSLNFEYSLKKDDLHSWCISEITNPQKSG